MPDEPPDVQRREPGTGGRKHLRVHPLYREKLRALAHDRARERLPRLRDLSEAGYLKAVDDVLLQQMSYLGRAYRDAMREEEAEGNLFGARRRRRVWSLGVATGAVVGTILVAVTSLAGPLTEVVAASVLLVASFTAELVRRLRPPAEQAELSYTRSMTGAARMAAFDDLLRQTVLLPAESRAREVAWTTPEHDVVSLEDGPALGAKAEPDQLITTTAGRRVTVALSRAFGSAIGIAGPRGAGKTEIARAVTSISSKRVSRTIGVFVWAPVSYDARTFLLRLYKELCLAVTTSPTLGGHHPRNAPRWLGHVTVAGWVLVVLGCGFLAWDLLDVDVRRLDAGAVAALAIPAGVELVVVGWVGRRLLSRGGAVQPSASALAADALRRIEFAETYSTGVEMSAQVKGIGASSSRGVELQRIPLSEVDIVREIEHVVKAVAASGHRTVIAIDELDKMRDDEEAIVFLNHLKVLFPIRDCSFVVSVSESAWARFEHRGLPFRDAFDSALDEVVYVDLLRPAESRDLLRHRAPEMTDLQCLLCHCLSGGLPRDLLRAARLLARTAAAVPTRAFVEVLDAVLADDLRSKVDAAELRVRGLDPMRQRADIMQQVSCWGDLWPDPAGTEKELSNRRQRAPRAADELSAAVEAVRDELACYIAFLHSVRQAFASGGPVATLAGSGFGHPVLTDGFAVLARARHRLSLDPAGAWELIHQGRAALGLQAVSR